MLSATNYGGLMINRLVLSNAIILCMSVSIFQARAESDLLARLFPNIRQIQEHKRLRQAHYAMPVKNRLQKRLSIPGASISGTVFKADSTPRGMASVTVIDTFGFEVATVQCDASGAYIVNGLYTGGYILWSNYYGNSIYANRNYFGNTSDISKALWVHAAANEQVTGKDIVEVSSPSKKGVVITGTCYRGDANDSPFQNYVTLRVIPADQAQRAIFPSVNGYYSWYSTVSGSFACTTSLDQGGYYIMIGRGNAYGSDVDTDFVAQWWDGSSITSEPIEAQLSSTTINKDIHFRTGSVISGSVRDEISDTLLGSVDIDLIDRDGYTVGSAYCGNYYSKFAFAGLAGGTYYLSVSYSSNDAYESTYYPQAGVRDSAAAIAIGASGNTQGISFVLKRAKNTASLARGTIEGTVTREDNGAALPNASITIGSPAGSGGTSISADASGSFHCDIPADSDIYIGAGQSSSASENTVDYYLKETWYPGVADMASATPIKVSAGGTKQITIAVKKGGGIAGWLRDANNGMIPGLSSLLTGPADYELGFVWAADFSVMNGTFVTDLSGFRVAGVGAGNYQARFISLGGLISGTGFSNYGYATINAVNVTNENTAFSRVLTLPLPSATISGTVAASPAQAGSAGFRDYVYCYSGDSIIAAYGLPRPAGPQSPKTYFFSLDGNAPNTGQPLEFSLGKLPAGKYALAHFRFLNSQSAPVEREWYPSGVFNPLNISDYTMYVKSVIKPDIPSSAWITLGASEAKANINFGNAGAIVSPPNSAGLAPRLWLANDPGRQSIVLHYALPKIDARKSGTLDIYRIDGMRVRTLGLFTSEGNIAWNGCSENGATVTSGVYVFRLNASGVSLSLKGALVK